MLHVAGNADHLEGRPARSLPQRIGDLLANRILARPHFLGELAADNHYTWGASAIASSEIASLKQRNAERPKVVRSNVIDVDPQTQFELTGLQQFRRRLLAGMEDGDRAGPLGGRDAAGETCGDNTRHRVQLV